ncbi:MAG: helix-turn-helix transcriptional regulator [Acidobacteria bacterium]|nr:helix-turn-helix transcriptional regulator [Acidobacteriota bacterium]
MHRNEYGPAGALFLSISINNAKLWDEFFGAVDWKWHTIGRVDLRSAMLAFSSPECLSPSDAAFELLAIAQRFEEPIGTPPRWIRHVREKLALSPSTSIQTLAAEAGVHRVYLARCFRKWYGVTPTAYRIHRQTSKALARCIFDGETALTAAYDYGFSDQSHLLRAVRRQTGCTLKHLRQWLHG